MTELKTAVISAGLCLFAVTLPLFAYGSYESGYKGDPDIYCMDKSYISELKSGLYSGMLITGEIPEASSVTHITVCNYFAEITIRSEEGRSSIAYTVKGLPEKAVKINRSSSSFELIERRLKHRTSMTHNTITACQEHTSIELILPQQMSDTAVHINTSFGSTAVSDLSCKTVNLDSGIGGIAITAVYCDDFIADTGSGSCTVSQLTCRTGHFDTGSGSCTLNDCRITEYGSFDTGSGSVHCSGTCYVNHPFFDTGSGAIRYEGRMEGAVRMETGSGRVYVDMQNSTVEQLLLDTGSGAIDVLNASCGVLSLDSGSGAVRLHNIRADKTAHISGSSAPVNFEQCILNDVDANLSSGSFSFSGILTGNCSLDAGSSSVTLNIQAPAEDYGVRIKDRRDTSAIRINGKMSSGEYILGNEHSKHGIAIDTGRRTFNINFKE